MTTGNIILLSISLGIILSIAFLTLDYVLRILRRKFKI